MYPKAKEIGMMNEGFVWIMTDCCLKADLLNTPDPSVTDAMQGVLGVRPGVPNTRELNCLTLLLDILTTNSNHLS